MKAFAQLVAFLLLTQTVGAQTEPGPRLSVSSGDVLRCQLFLFKQPGSGPTGFLRIGFSPAKSAELLALAASNPQRQVRLVLKGKTVFTVDAPKKGSAFDTKISSPENAFATAEAMIRSPTEPAPVFAPMPDAPMFSLRPADVHKVVLTLSKDRVELEATFVKEKQAEFAKTAAAHLQKKGEILLNGKIAGELTITKPTLGHSVKVEMPSASDAFALAEVLIDSTPNSPDKTPQGVR